MKIAGSFVNSLRLDAIELLMQSAKSAPEIGMSLGIKPE